MCNAAEKCQWNYCCSYEHNDLAPLPFHGTSGRPVSSYETFQNSLKGFWFLTSVYFSDPRVKVIIYKVFFFLAEVKGLNYVFLQQLICG